MIVDRLATRPAAPAHGSALRVRTAVRAGLITGVTIPKLDGSSKDTG